MLSARETSAVVRPWFPEWSASASGQEQAMLSARETSAAVRLWFPERSASASGQERSMVSVSVKK
jgi:hypothetical protein